MTVLQATERVRDRWRKRADEVRAKLTDLRNEQIAYTDLLRTIEAQVTAAEMAVAAAKEAPPKRSVR